MKNHSIFIVETIQENSENTNNTRKVISQYNTMNKLNVLSSKDLLSFIKSVTNLEFKDSSNSFLNKNEIIDFRLGIFSSYTKINNNDNILRLNKINVFNTAHLRNFNEFFGLIGWGCW